tara:strand:+ start:902 stop:1309 length:408 start_codon:yes stop_codon:yes gene_type:complete
MWAESDVDLVLVEWLKPHEQVKEKARDKLLDMTQRWGGFTKPVLVDRETGSLLDGHHRLSVAKRLNLRLIPAICIDYLNSDLIAVELWQNASVENLNKEMVLEMCLSSDLFPPKTTRHITTFDYPPIMVLLEHLR